MVKSLKILISERRLNNGSLLPLFFLLVTKGFRWLVGRTVELGLLSGFKLETFDLVVSHLLYANYSFILGDTNVDSLWVIKSIIKGSELALGHQINFSPAFC